MLGSVVVYIFKGLRFVFILNNFCEFLSKIMFLNYSIIFFCKVLFVKKLFIGIFLRLVF